MADEFRVYNIKCEILREDYRTQKGPNAQCIIKTEKLDSKGNAKSVQVKIPIQSIWIDTNKNKAVKFISIVNISEESNLDVRNFVQYLYLEKTVDMYSDSMRFICERIGKTNKFIVCYSSQDIYYTTEEGSWKKYSFFNNKCHALNDLLESAQRSKTIGGLSLVNLQFVSDNVLQEVGFEEIKDELNVNPSMWKGNSDIALNASPGFSGYKQLEGNVESFIYMIEAELNE